MSDVLKMPNRTRLPGDRITKTFTPICEGVVIQIIPQTQSSGGIVLPGKAFDTGRDNPNNPTGWVIAVGPQVKQIKEGDKVLIGMGNVQVVVYPGIQLGELIVTTENHCLGIVDLENGKFAI